MRTPVSFAAAMHDRRGHQRVPVPRLLALALATAAIAAACGTNAPSGTPGQATPRTTSGPGTLPPSATASPLLPPPTPEPTLPPSVAEPCLASDLKASHGLVEGAAGSRLTEIVLVSATTCSIDAFPFLGLRDAAGRPLVGGQPTGTGRIDLDPDRAYTTVARLANWCQPEPEFPLALEIRLGAEAVPVTGDSFPAEGDLPPCNGEGVGAVLEAGAWVASE